MPKYSKSQRKTRRRAYRKRKSTIMTCNVFGKPQTSTKRKKIAASGYKSVTYNWD